MLSLYVVPRVLERWLREHGADCELGLFLFFVFFLKDRSGGVFDICHPAHFYVHYHLYCTLGCCTITN